MTDEKVFTDGYERHGRSAAKDLTHRNKTFQKWEDEDKKHLKEHQLSHWKEK